MGQAAAAALAQAGCSIFGVDINIPSEETKKLVEDAGASYHECRYDIAAEMDHAAELIEKAAQVYGHIDYLVNVAGVSPVSDTIDQFDFAKDYDRVLDLNLNGQAHLDIEFSKYLIKQGTGGRILNWSSMSAHFAQAKGIGLGYSVAKCGILGLTRSLAIALREYGITVNAISPAGVLTNFARTGGYGDNTEELCKSWGVDIAKMRKPEDIMGMVVLLCSDAGSAFNGAEFVFDGGDSLILY